MEHKGILNKIEQELKKHSKIQKQPPPKKKLKSKKDTTAQLQLDNHTKFQISERVSRSFSSDDQKSVHKVSTFASNQFRKTCKPVPFERQLTTLLPSLRAFTHLAIDDHNPLFDSVPSANSSS